MTIHQAVSSGDALLVECVVDTRPDVLEHRNTLGRTALLQAAANGNLNIVELLVLKGANIHAHSYTTDNSSMAIHLAAENGHDCVVNYILQIAPDLLEAKDKDGDTPLSRAAYNGKNSVVQLLLSHHVNIEAPGYRCRTPLLRAAANGHTETIKILLQAGANILAKSNHQDFEKNAVYLAAVFGHVETVDFLTNVEPELANTTNIHNDTLICYAALGGHVPVIELVLEKFKANIETTGRFGRTPLLQSASMGHLDAVKYLVGRGANIYAQSSPKDEEQACIHLAARFGHPLVVQYLVDVDPQLPKLCDKQGRAAYDSAKQYNRKQVMEILEEYMA